MTRSRSHRSLRHAQGIPDAPQTCHSLSSGYAFAPGTAQTQPRHARDTPQTRPRHAPDTLQTGDRGAVGDGLLPSSRRLGAWRAPAGPGALRKCPQAPGRARFATRPSHTVRRFCTPRTPDCGNVGARPPGYLRPRLVPPGPSPSSGPPGYPPPRRVPPRQAHHQGGQDTLARAPEPLQNPRTGRAEHGKW